MSAISGRREHELERDGVLGLRLSRAPGRAVIDDASWLGLSNKGRSGYLVERSLDNARTILDFDLNSTRSFALQNMMLQGKLKIITTVLANSIKAGASEREARQEEQREQIFGEMAEEYRRLKSVK